MATRPPDREILSTERSKMIAILFDMEIIKPPNVCEKATRDPMEFEKKEYYTTSVYSPCKITTFNTLEKRLLHDAKNKINRPTTLESDAKR